MNKIVPPEKMKILIVSFIIIIILIIIHSIYILSRN